MPRCIPHCAHKPFMNMFSPSPEIFPKFVVWGDTALGKILSVLLYLLQVRSFLFLLFWLGRVFWLDIHQEANPHLGSNNIYLRGFS